MATRVRIRWSDPKERRKIRAAVLRLGLDRRRAYCLGYDGELSNPACVTAPCSGCSCDCGDGYPCSHGNAGCRWCGYTGKSRVHFPAPVIVDGKIIQITNSP